MLRFIREVICVVYRGHLPEVKAKIFRYIDDIYLRTADMACQMHRDYYKGYPKHYHPITYFKEPEYMWQCPSEISHAYLSFPAFHVKYKQLAILPPTAGRTSVFPQLPERSLAARYNKAACKAFVR